MLRHREAAETERFAHPTERWLRQVGRAGFGPSVQPGAATGDGAIGTEARTGSDPVLWHGRAASPKSRTAPGSGRRWTSPDSRLRPAERRGEPADEVTRLRGRRTAGQRDRRAGRTRKSTSLRRGRWTGEAGPSPRGAAARNHPSGGLRPERRMGSGRGDRAAGRRARPGCPGRASARSEHQGEASRSLEGTSAPRKVSTNVLRHGRRGSRRQRGVAGPASGPDPEVGSHLGAAGHRRRVARRRMEWPQADLPGAWASVHGKERRVCGRGGWTGLLGTNVPRRRASARRSGAGGPAGRLAGRRRLEPRHTGFGPGAREARSSRCRETGGTVQPEARSCFGRAASTGQPGRRWQERPQADLPGTWVSAHGKERRAYGRGGSTGASARACREAALRCGGATRAGRRVA